MKLRPLFEMTVRYTESHWAEPLNGPDGHEGIAWALREGELAGERIRGTYRACNHPYRRADDVNVPDVHGVISTEDGALVYYEIHGYGLLDPGQTTRRVVGAVTFRTAADRYRWLNLLFGTVEGRYVRTTDGRLEGHFRAFECVSDDETVIAGGMSPG